ncbi:hypothetical protein Vretifemale_15235, partial [Volvox reticuliferus]
FVNGCLERISILWRPMVARCIFLSISFSYKVMVAGRGWSVPPIDQFQMTMKRQQQVYVVPSTYVLTALWQLTSISLHGWLLVTRTSCQCTKGDELRQTGTSEYRTAHPTSRSVA